MQIVSSARNKNGKIKVSIDKERPMSQCPLYNRYEIQRYDLHPGYSFAHMDEMVPKGTPYYIDSGNHYVERIVRALYYFKQCSLIGPSGTGKTHIVYLVAELCGLPVYEVNCGLQTSSYDLIGRFIGLGKENWIDGMVTRWLRTGGIMYLDEANMMKQDVATRLNPVLDTRGHLVLNEKDNVCTQTQIRVHGNQHEPPLIRILWNQTLERSHETANGSVDKLRLHKRRRADFTQRSRTAEETSPS
jgi:nitric oxide reductase NorQ protein